MSTQTQIFYRGDGTTVLFSFPFPYIDESHVTVALLNDTTKAYDNIPQDDATYPWRLATASQVEFTSTAPPVPTSGDPDNVLIERKTDADAAYATFFPGSPIKAADLNDNFEQSIYVAQESATVSKRAEDLVESVEILSIQTKAIADQAGADASQAKSDAATALSQSTTALSTANQSVSDASNAITQATTANNNATTASVDAAQAKTDAAQAVSDSAQAVSDASSALSLATTADSNATTALNTANTASTNATTALAQSNTAISDSNAAKASADAAVAAVANVLSYTQITNVAAIPGSPLENDAIQVVDSTGLESFTPLTGLPGGYVGDPGIAARLVYNSPNWVFQNYIANDPDNRYLNPTDTLELIKRDGSVAMTAPLTFGTGGKILQQSSGILVSSDADVELFRSTPSNPLEVTGNITVTGTVDGRDVAADGTKLDGIDVGATDDQTGSEILAALAPVDGTGSGLDSDLLDGQEGSYYLDYNNLSNKPTFASTSLTDSSTLVRNGDGISKLNNDAGYLNGIPNQYISTQMVQDGAIGKGKLARNYIEDTGVNWSASTSNLKWSGNNILTASSSALRFDAPGTSSSRTIYFDSNIETTVTRSRTISNFGYLSNNSGAPANYFSGSQSGAFSAYFTGRVRAQQFDATSDRRLKENIFNIPTESAVAFVENVSPVTYTWKSDPEQGTRAGYIAQDIAQAGFFNFLSQNEAQVEGDEFDPVTGVKNPTDGYYAVNYLEAIPYLHKAIADALQRIAHLETLINDQSA